LLEKEQVVMDNNKCNARIRELESLGKDFEGLLKKYDAVHNQLNYYKSNFKNQMQASNSAEGNSQKDLYNQNKNLEFYSEMLIKEKDSLLEQINMYNDINLECFDRIKELKTTVDKQYVIIQKLQVEKLDLEHIRSILGTSDDM